jgi:uncharacterized phage protein (TIGR01671 family)
MREILFRGKRIDNDEWVEGYLIYDEFCNTSIPYIGYLYGDGADVVEVTPETVGQYMGLKDKNGKRIFEGDIVYVEYDQYTFDGSSTEHRAVRGAIGYDTIGMIGIIVEQYQGEPVWSDFFNVLALTDSIKDWSIEVIGNIYDNSKLLGGKQ